MDNLKYFLMSRGYDLDTVIALGAVIFLSIVIIITSISKKKKGKATKGENSTREATQEAAGTSVVEEEVADKPKDGKKARRSKEPSKGKMKTITSTQESSNVVDVKDGVIVTKDGLYFKILEFLPVNFKLVSPEEQDNIIHQFSSIIRTWPDTVHIKVISAQADLSPFIDDLNRSKRRELEAQNRACAGLIDDQISLIQSLSQNSGGSRRFFIFLQYRADVGFKKSPPFSDVVNSLNTEARAITAALEACGNSVASSDNRDYILSVFYKIMSNSASESYPFEERKRDILHKYELYNHGIPVPADRIPINDFIVPTKIDTSISPKYILIDGKYVAYTYIPADAYPTQCIGGWLEQIFGYMDDVDCDVWIRREDVESIQRQLTLQLKSNKVKSWHAEDTAQDYDDIMAALSSGYYLKEQLANGDDFCYFSIILTIYADTLDELNERYDALKNYLIRRDLTLRRLTFQQKQGYEMCLPTSTYNKQIGRKTRRNVMASQLGSIYPFTAFELHDKDGIFLGINDDHGTPCFINTFDTKKYQNSNMMILGPSGSGKSFSLMCMLLRMRQRGLQVFVIAPLKGFEFYRACSAIGGEFIRIAPGSAQNINIMEIRKRDTSDAEMIDGLDGNSSASIVTDKIQQVARFFTLLLPDIQTVEKQILDDCLVKTYEKFGIYTRSNKSLIDPKSPTGEYKEMPVLGDLLKTLQEYDKDDPSQSARRMRGALAKFVTGSAKSFNLPTNVNLDNKFVVLDVSDLTPEMLPIGMFIALDYAMDKAKQDRTKRKVIAIDELWRLMKASQLSAEYVVEAFKIIRGYAGAAIGATQDLDDILGNEYGAAIINNAKFKLLLPMDKKEADAAASVIDLTSAEKAKLKQTTLTRDGGGRRALLVADRNRVFVRVKASDKEFNLITTDANELARQKNAFMNRQRGGA